MTPPGILWTWYDDRNQVEAAIQIARVWYEFAKNGVEPWAVMRLNVAERYDDAVRVRQTLKKLKRHRVTSKESIDLAQIWVPILASDIPARGAESFIEPAIMRWRYRDALDVLEDAARRVTPRIALALPSRRVRQAFEAIIAADEIPTAYAYLGADPEWWSPESDSHEY